uniref:Thioredoxin like 4B n=1 Tax=Felis catus TaxID=9685 RepID=A0ABI7WBR5_FELCA
MSFLLPKLTSKKEVDQAIKSTAEKVLVLRFGRDEDPVCLQLDDILSKTSSDLSKMAAIYLVDVDQTPVYTHYFDISYIPSTVFFFNGQHMKVDYGVKSCCQARAPSQTALVASCGFLNPGQDGGHFHVHAVLSNPTALIKAQDSSCIPGVVVLVVNGKRTASITVASIFLKLRQASTEGVLIQYGLHPYRTLR